jgi:uncharacterized membrane protein
MGNVKGVDGFTRSDYEPRTGTDTGVFILEKHTAAACSGSGTSYTITNMQTPVGDLNCDGVVDASDIVAYVDGVEATVSAFTVTGSTGTITLGSSTTGTVTCDYYELHEAVSLQDWSQQNKPKEIKWDEVRDSQEITMYTGSTDTLDLNMKSVGPTLMDICFDSSTHEKLDVPPEVGFAIVHFARSKFSGEKDWALYCTSADLVLDQGSKGKALDLEDMTMKLALREPLKLASSITSGYLLDSGIA